MNIYGFLFLSLICIQGSTPLIASAILQENTVPALEEKQSTTPDMAPDEDTTKPEKTDSTQPDTGCKVIVLTLDGTINPATTLYIEKGLAKAEDLFILKLNTPGGLLSSTRDIVQAFLDSDVPVVVYVSPRGGQAASAGMFITMAGHFAVMEPATNIGAASPVHMNQGEEKEESSNSKTLAKKAMNDTSAFARSIAVERNRNAEWAELAVREAVSLTALEAVEQNVVDFIAGDLDELLEQLNGKQYKTPAGEKTLNTESCQVEIFEMGLKERLLDLISNPNIAYILMILGFYGIYFEFSNPGALFPGIAGAICLILGFFAMQTLPLDVAGIALILLGLILFALETQIPSGGMLSVGAIISFSLGSFMLFEPEASFPALRVSFSVIIPVVIFTAAFFMFAVGLALKAQQRKTVTGNEGLLGQTARVCTALTPEGQVEVHGETWKATCPSGEVAVEQTVVIVKVSGLTLEVEPQQ